MATHPRGNVSASASDSLVTNNGSLTRSRVVSYHSQNISESQLDDNETLKSSDSLRVRHSESISATALSPSHTNGPIKSASFIAASATLATSPSLPAASLSVLATASLSDSNTTVRPLPLELGGRDNGEVANVTTLRKDGVMLFVGDPFSLEVHLAASVLIGPCSSASDQSLGRVSRYILSPFVDLGAGFVGIAHAAIAFIVFVVHFLVMARMAWRFYSVHTMADLWAAFPFYQVWDAAWFPSLPFLVCLLLLPGSSIASFDIIREGSIEAGGGAVVYVSAALAGLIMIVIFGFLVWALNQNNPVVDARALVVMKSPSERADLANDDARMMAKKKKSHPVPSGGKTLITWEANAALASSAPPVVDAENSAADDDDDNIDGDEAVRANKFRAEDDASPLHDSPFKSCLRSLVSQKSHHNNHFMVTHQRSMVAVTGFAVVESSSRRQQHPVATTHTISDGEGCNHIAENNNTTCIRKMASSADSCCVGRYAQKQNIIRLARRGVFSLMITVVVIALLILHTARGHSTNFGTPPSSNEADDGFAPSCFARLIVSACLCFIFSLLVAVLRPFRTLLTDALTSVSFAACAVLLLVMGSESSSESSLLEAHNSYYSPSAPSPAWVTKVLALLILSSTTLVRSLHIAITVYKTLNVHRAGDGDNIVSDDHLSIANEKKEKVEGRELAKNCQKYLEVDRSFWEENAEAIATVLTSGEEKWAAGEDGQSASPSPQGVNDLITPIKQKRHIITTSNDATPHHEAILMSPPSTFLICDKIRPFSPAESIDGANAILFINRRDNRRPSVEASTSTLWNRPYVSAGTSPHNNDHNKAYTMRRRTAAAAPAGSVCSSGSRGGRSPAGLNLEAVPRNPDDSENSSMRFGVVVHQTPRDGKQRQQQPPSSPSAEGNTIHYVTVNRNKITNSSAYNTSRGSTACNSPLFSPVVVASGEAYAFPLRESIFKTTVTNKKSVGSVMVPAPITTFRSPLFDDETEGGAVGGGQQHPLGGTSAVSLSFLYKRVPSSPSAKHASAAANVVRTTSNSHQCLYVHRVPSTTTTQHQHEGSLARFVPFSAIDVRKSQSEEAVVSRCASYFSTTADSSPMQSGVLDKVCGEVEGRGRRGKQHAVPQQRSGESREIKGGGGRTPSTVAELLEAFSSDDDDNNTNHNSHVEHVSKHKKMVVTRNDNTHSTSLGFSTVSSLPRPTTSRRESQRKQHRGEASNRIASFDATTTDTSAITSPQSQSSRSNSGVFAHHATTKQPQHVQNVRSVSHFDDDDEDDAYTDAEEGGGRGGSWVANGSSRRHGGGGGGGRVALGGGRTIGCDALLHQQSLHNDADSSAESSRRGRKGGMNLFSSKAVDSDSEERLENHEEEFY